MGTQSDGTKAKFSIELYKITRIIFSTPEGSGEYVNAASKRSEYFIKGLKSVLCDEGDVTSKTYLTGSVSIDVSIYSTRITAGSLLTRSMVTSCDVYVPMVLYMFKNDIKSKLKVISKNHDVHAELLCSHEIFITVIGLEKNMDSAIFDIYRILENIFEREVRKVNGFFTIQSLLDSGSAGVYFVTRINCSGIYITSKLQEANTIFKHLKKPTLVKRRVSVDSFKLLFLLYYQKRTLDELLCELECFLQYESNKLLESSMVELQIIGFSEITVQKCLRKIRNLFQEVVKLLTRDQLTSYSLCNVFYLHFDGKRDYSVPNENKKIFHNKNPDLCSTDSVQSTKKALIPQKKKELLVSSRSCEKICEFKVHPKTHPEINYTILPGKNMTDKEWILKHQQLGDQFEQKNIFKEIVCDGKSIETGPKRTGEFSNIEEKNIGGIVAVSALDNALLFGGDIQFKDEISEINDCHQIYLDAKQSDSKDFAIIDSNREFRDSKNFLAPKKSFCERIQTLSRSFHCVDARKKENRNNGSLGFATKMYKVPSNDRFCPSDIEMLSKNIKTHLEPFETDNDFYKDEQQYEFPDSHPNQTQFANPVFFSNFCDRILGFDLVYSHLGCFFDRQESKNRVSDGDQDYEEIWARCNFFVQRVPHNLRCNAHFYMCEFPHKHTECVNERKISTQSKIYQCNPEKFEYNNVNQIRLAEFFKCNDFHSSNVERIQPNITCVGDLIHKKRHEIRSRFFSSNIFCKSDRNKIKKNRLDENIVKSEKQKKRGCVENAPYDENNMNSSLNITKYPKDYKAADMNYIDCSCSFFGCKIHLIKSKSESYLGDIMNIGPFLYSLYYPRSCLKRRLNLFKRNVSNRKCEKKIPCYLDDTNKTDADSNSIQYTDSLSRHQDPDTTSCHYSNPSRLFGFNKAPGSRIHNLLDIDSSNAIRHNICKTPSKNLQNIGEFDELTQNKLFKNKMHANRSFSQSRYSKRSVFCDNKQLSLKNATEEAQILQGCSLINSNTFSERKKGRFLNTDLYEKSPTITLSHLSRKKPSIDYTNDMNPQGMGRINSLSDLMRETCLVDKQSHKVLSSCCSADNFEHTESYLHRSTNFHTKDKIFGTKNTDDFTTESCHYGKEGFLQSSPEAFESKRDFFITKNDEIAYKKNDYLNDSKNFSEKGFNCRNYDYVISNSGLASQIKKLDEDKCIVDLDHTKLHKSKCNNVKSPFFVDNIQKGICDSSHIKGHSDFSDQLQSNLVAANSYKKIKPSGISRGSWDICALNKGEWPTTNRISELCSVGKTQTCAKIDLFDQIEKHAKSQTIKFNDGSYSIVADCKVKNLGKLSSPLNTLHNNSNKCQKPEKIRIFGKSTSHLFEKSRNKTVDPQLSPLFLSEKNELLNVSEIYEFQLRKSDSQDSSTIIQGPENSAYSDKNSFKFKIDSNALNPKSYDELQSFSYIDTLERNNKKENDLALVEIQETFKSRGNFKQNMPLKFTKPRNSNLTSGFELRQSISMQCGGHEENLHTDKKTYSYPKTTSFANFDHINRVNTHSDANHSTNSSNLEPCFKVSVGKRNLCDNQTKNMINVHEDARYLSDASRSLKISPKDSTIYTEKFRGIFDSQTESDNKLMYSPKSESKIGENGRNRLCCNIMSQNYTSKSNSISRQIGANIININNQTDHDFYFYDDKDQNHKFINKFSRLNIYNVTDGGAWKSPLASQKLGNQKTKCAICHFKLLFEICPLIVRYFEYEASIGCYPCIDEPRVKSRLLSFLGEKKISQKLIKAFSTDTMNYSQFRPFLIDTADSRCTGDHSVGLFSYKYDQSDQERMKSKESIEKINSIRKISYSNSNNSGTQSDSLEFDEKIVKPLKSEKSSTALEYYLVDSLNKSLQNVKNEKERGNSPSPHLESSLSTLEPLRQDKVPLRTIEDKTIKKSTSQPDFSTSNNRNIPFYNKVLPTGSPNRKSNNFAGITEKNKGSNVFQKLSNKQKPVSKLEREDRITNIIDGFRNHRSRMNSIASQNNIMQSDASIKCEYTSKNFTTIQNTKLTDTITQKNHENTLSESRGCIVIGMRNDIKELIKPKKSFVDPHDYIEVEIEIDAELEDFLCGKKNGKINKIAKDNDCEVKIEHRIANADKIIGIYISGSCLNMYRTIVQLECEYPADLCFNLHEKHHKRIIGYGGKNIQKIMKKHGVYIKFMSETERIKNGHDGNVIIKTPKRNKESLLRMQNEVLNLAEEILHTLNPRSVFIKPFYIFEFRMKCMRWGIQDGEILYHQNALDSKKDVKIRTYQIPTSVMAEYYRHVSLEPHLHKIFILGSHSVGQLITLRQYNLIEISTRDWVVYDSIHTFKAFNCSFFLSTRTYELGSEISSNPQIHNADEYEIKPNEFRPIDIVDEEFL